MKKLCLFFVILEHCINEKENLKRWEDDDVTTLFWKNKFWFLFLWNKNVKKRISQFWNSNKIKLITIFERELF